MSDSNNENTYDLSIFDKKEYLFELDSSCSINAEINFSVHCYTEEWKNGDSTEDIIKDNYGNSRSFCPIRYEYALKSISQIDQWLNNACIRSKDAKRGNEHWLLIEDVNGQQGKIAFSIKKHTNTKKVNGIWMSIKTIHPYDKSTPPDLSVTAQTPFKKLTKAVGVFNTKLSEITLRVPKKLQLPTKTTES